MSAVRNLVPILFAAACGAIVSATVIGSGWTNLSSWENTPTPTAEQLYPLPHHISKYPGGVSLRFAMVHDVIHERFPRHGHAYYEERNRRAIEAMKEDEAKLASGAKPSDQYWVLLDDLGVGLERLGKHEEAVARMRKKLTQQQELVFLGNNYLYSTYANLGTFLILWQIAEGFDKPNAKDRTKESIEWIRKAIDAKPDSHFGREIWQLVLEEFVLTVLDNPKLFLWYDMVGNRLDKEVNPATLRSFKGAWAHGDARWAKTFLQDTSPSPVVGRETDDKREHFREQITLVGAEDGWAQEVKTSHTKPLPFDEPALGIIGMWRYGGGANPHFALALGEITLRVGQRYIAWTAYERAAQLAPALGEPTAAKFIEHCRKRQKVIEDQLPASEVAEMRPRFEKELAFGQRYQKAYQDYEARRIQEGASIDDPHFYDAFSTSFTAEHGPIASPVGVEDHFVVEGQSLFVRISRTSLPAVLLSAGLCAFLTACRLRFLQIRKQPIPSKETVSPTP
jgi:hypothetical protein